jgi:hypothetical protein
VDNELDVFLSALQRDPSRHTLPHPPKSDVECRLDTPDVAKLLDSLLRGPLETACCMDFARVYGPLPTMLHAPAPFAWLTEGSLEQ